MSVGGVIVDIVTVADDRWWINTVEPGADTRAGRTVAVYCDPRPATRAARGRRFALVAGADLLLDACGSLASGRATREDRVLGSRASACAALSGL
jgi:hypothetical protein